MKTLWSTITCCYARLCETKQFVEQQLDADLIVLDLNLPDRDGFSAEDDFPRGADFGMNPSAQRSSARTALSRC
jgi:hypothetical protein